MVGQGGAVLGKGALGQAAAAGTNGDPVEAGKCWAENDGRMVLLDAVAGQAVFVTVEEDGVLGVVRVAPPVPVGLVAGVAALGTEGVLVVPEVVSVPGKEEGLRRVSTSRAMWELG